MVNPHARELLAGVTWVLAEVVPLPGSTVICRGGACQCGSRCLLGCCRGWLLKLRLCRWANLCRHRHCHLSCRRRRLLQGLLGRSWPLPCRFQWLVLCRFWGLLLCRLARLRRCRLWLWLLRRLLLLLLIWFGLLRLFWSQGLLCPGAHGASTEVIISLWNQNVGSSHVHVLAFWGAWPSSNIGLGSRRRCVGGSGRGRRLYR